MQGPLDWDDFRFLLAIGESGSFARAARRLGVDQATVGRRYRVCEAAIGVPLLERLPGAIGWTAAGARVLDAARVMAGAQLELERALAAGIPGISGILRITTTETLASRVIAPEMGRLREEHPKLELELHAGNARLSLSEREADIAVRLDRPEESSVVSKRLGTLGFALYASVAYVERFGSPSLENRESLWFVGYERPLAALSEVLGWVDNLALERVVLRCNATATMTSAIAFGAGVGVLPCLVGDTEPNLFRVGSEVRTRPVWLVVHEASKRSARIRAGIEFLESLFRRRGAELLGRQPASPIRALEREDRGRLATRRSASRRGWGQPQTFPRFRERRSAPESVASRDR
ncbi:MAG: LysR family transcriptional regulator [Polyangiaceae bacterium]